MVKDLFVDVVIALLLIMLVVLVAAFAVATVQLLKEMFDWWR